VSGSASEKLEPPPPFRTMGRYEIQRVLGRGGMGVVYEALDTKDDAVVALKMIDSKGESDGVLPARKPIAGDESEAAERLYRLKQEFRAVADLQHPNLIRLGELSSHEGQWFFTMELVRGASFVDYVRHRAGGGEELDQDRLRTGLTQLVSALEAIHDAGQVHRDVKPSNVLVSEEGRVVVLDFGLMSSTEHSGRKAGVEPVSGTPDYMAPEQIEGLPAEQATDWYGVGAMLFACLTGRPPFVGSAMDVMEAKLTRHPPSPRELAPDIPADLEALCLALLRIDPHDRPAAREVRERLGMQERAWRAGAAPESTLIFIGRENELRELEDAFIDVVAGKARTVVVEGEPGIGKSTLVQRFLGSLRDRTLILSGRSYEQESVPFKGLDAIVDALSEFLLELPESRTRALIGGGIRFLATVFPVLNRVPLIAEATSNARLVDKPLALREQAFGEFERLIGALARERTLVLFLDDVQWADKDSLALLRRTLRQEGGVPVLFLATLRAGVGGAGPDLAPGAEELLAGASWLSLRGLTGSESKRLCADLLRASGRSPTAGSEDALVREAAGHPLYLSELVRSAGRTERVEEGATKLQDVLWERVQERAPLERRFLEMLAIAGSPIAYELVARAAELDVGECQTHLSALRAAQLVLITRRDDERLVVLYHDRIRETVLLHRLGAGAGEGIVQDHLRLGRTILHATPPEARNARIFAIVQHLNIGRDQIAGPERRELAELNLAAAREAVLTTAYEAAQTYARIGSDLLGESGWRDAYATFRDLEVERIRAEYLGGDVAGARQSFELASTKIQVLADRTDLYIAWIELETSRGDFASALESARARLRELGVSTPASATPLTVLGRFLLTRLAQSGRTPDELRALPTLAEPLRENAMKLLMAMTPAAYWTSSDLVGWIALELARTSIRFGVSAVSSYAFATYGVVLSGAFGKCAEAAATGRLAIALNDRFGNANLEPSLYLINGTFLAPWVQPFAEAKALLQTAYERAVKYGDATYEVYAACALSHISAIEAVDLPAHEQVSEWARVVCTRRKDWNMVGSVVSHLLYLTVLRGTEAPDFTRGATLDPNFLALAGDAKKAPSAHDGYFQFNAWIAYLFGETEIAAACLVETRKLAQAHFAHLTTLDLCFLECLVAAKLHDRASWWKRARLRWSLARRVRALRTWAAGCPQNFETHYRIALAELTRVRGDAWAAETRFEEAIAATRAHGSVLREGLALELAMDLARQQGQAAKAAALRTEAIAAYRRCGANAKAKRLEEGGGA
jgi:serine/threonine protein kinase